MGPLRRSGSHPLRLVSTSYTFPVSVCHGRLSSGPSPKASLGLGRLTHSRRSAQVCPDPSGDRTKRSHFNEHEYDPEAVFAGAAGVGWRKAVIVPMSSLDSPRRDCSDLPLPRWGVLSGKSPCTSRRWRLYFVQFQPPCAGKDSASQDETDVLTAKRHRVDVAKVRTTVEAEVSAKQTKAAAKQKKTVSTKAAKPAKAA
jgi:hypothetical protein